MRRQNASTRSVERSVRDEDLLKSGLALLVDWTQPVYERFLEQVDHDVDSWWSRGTQEVKDGEFDFLKSRQQKQLSALCAEPKKRLIQRVQQWPGHVVVCHDVAYPQRLLDLQEPPAALHVVGDVGCLQRSGLAVVGSRKIGVAAASSARRVLQSAIESGLMIISGGARGADAVAHRCAVDVGGATVVVLPSGLAKRSPKSNRRLFQDIADGAGALISEYPPRQGVRRYHFHRRNRLIAGLSLGVLVLRAAQKSGTMLTVDAARELGRPLGAMSGAPEDPLSRGCHEILRQGGRFIASSQDLLQWWKDLAPEQPVQQAQSVRDHQEERAARSWMPDCPILKKAVELVDATGCFSSEALARQTEASAAELQTLLLRHELSGIIERATGGDRYRFRHGDCH